MCREHAHGACAVTQLTCLLMSSPISDCSPCSCCKHLQAVHTAHELQKGSLVSLGESSCQFLQLLWSFSGQCLCV